MPAKATFVELQCDNCGVPFKRPAHIYADTISKGHKHAYCSMKCKHAHSSTLTKRKEEVDEATISLLEQIYRKKCKLMYYRISLWIMDQDDINDIIHNTFVYLLTHKIPYKTPAHLTSITFRTLKWKISDYLLDQRRRFIFSLKDIDFADDRDTPREELFCKLHEEITKLPPTHRQIAEYILKGFPKNEIPAMIGIGKSLLFKNQKELLLMLKAPLKEYA